LGRGARGSSSGDFFILLPLGRGGEAGTDEPDA
jgi:hypothetical protein